MKVGKVSAEEAAFIEQSVKDLRGKSMHRYSCDIDMRYQKLQSPFEGSVVNDMILLPILFSVSRRSEKLSLCEEYFQTMDTDNSGKVTYASWLPQKRLSPLAASGISRQNFNPGFLFQRVT